MNQHSSSSLATFQSPIMAHHIFSDNKKKVSAHSAARYSYKPELSEGSPQELPAKTKKKVHRRTNSHHRQHSIYFPPDSNLESMLFHLKTHENLSHTRNLSDADSVVYLGPGDYSNLNTEIQENSDKKNEFQLSIIETAAGSILSTEKPSILPILGEIGISTYCRYCKCDVHTTVDFNQCYTSKILKAVSSVITCCSYPDWLAAYRVHKCPDCSLVLGKSR